jgi:hypothetical protein
MKDVSERFWSANVEEMKRGYVWDADGQQFHCLVCGQAFEKGVVYRQDDTWYEAEKYTSLHVREEHSSMFDYLIRLNKKFTGLTDLQKSLLDYFYKGYSDNEIVKMEGGSASTIRNHRFTLREKEKQAKVFLAIMELMEAAPQPHKPKFLPIHKTATAVDERYAITEQENEEILRMYFPNGMDGQMSSFPKKEKRKIALLKHIVGRFEIGKKYKEKEVNEILKQVFADYVTIRRYLIEYGFLDRLDDGSEYWVNV